MNAVYTLGVMSTMRGMDSTGLFFLTRNKDKIEPCLFKDTEIAPVLMNSVLDNGKVKTKKDNTIAMVMGHTRAATLGAIIPATAHPFAFKNIVGCHNGTCHFMVPTNLTPEQKETQLASDSYHIFKHMDEHGLDSTLNKLKGGAYALAWWDRRDGSLNFIRNDKRPLTFASNGGTMYWASEARFLEFMKERTKFAGLTLKDAEPYVHYKLAAGSSTIKLEEVDKTSVAKPEPPKVTVFNSSKYDRARYEYPWSTWEQELEKEVTEETKSFGSPYQRILTNPKATEYADKTLDYFQMVNEQGTVVNDPSIDEVHELCQEGCCYCGEVHTHAEAPQLAFFAGNPEDLKTAYYVCNSCLKNENNGFFMDNESFCLEMTPVYRMVTNG